MIYLVARCITVQTDILLSLVHIYNSKTNWQGFLYCLEISVPTYTHILQVNVLIYRANHVQSALNYQDYNGVQ